MNAPGPSQWTPPYSVPQHLLSCQQPVGIWRGRPHSAWSVPPPAALTERVEEINTGAQSIGTCNSLAAYSWRRQWYWAPYHTSLALPRHLAQPSTPCEPQLRKSPQSLPCLFSAAGSPALWGCRRISSPALGRGFILPHGMCIYARSPPPGPRSIDSSSLLLRKAPVPEVWLVHFCYWPIHQRLLYSGSDHSALSSPL